MRGGREGGRGEMTVIHIILMAPYIQTNNEELYLYNNDVTYYVITCNSAFEYNNDVTYYVITRNYQWTPEILTNNLLEAGCTNKLCPFQFNPFHSGYSRGCRLPFHSGYDCRRRQRTW